VTPTRPIICLVTDRRRLGPDDARALPEVVAASAAAARAGVDLIHIRERDLTDSLLFELVRQVLDAVKGARTFVVVNDRADLAIAAGAHGVHLRADSVSPADVRRIAPPGFLIGRSVHAPTEAEIVEREGGADYLVFGTVFPSTSKPERAPAGLDMLRRVCGAVRLPVLAIGGMTIARARDVARAGAAGIAAIGLFASTQTGGDPNDLVIRLRDALTRDRRVV
jgi:thiamine-phosphate diphosphorylase